MKVLWPALMSQTLPLQVWNWLSNASGAAVPPTPVPVSVADCGLLGALSVTWNVVVRVPFCVGEKVNDMTHVPPGGSVRPEHWSSLVVKSSECVAALLMKRFAPPLFLTVIVLGALVVPTVWEA